MSETRGRKRVRDNTIPAHINPDKLPAKCYWDKSGSGHWYTIFTDETSRTRRKRIAGRHATLSELHKIIEEFNGIQRNTFDWISDQFKQSSQYRELALNTRKGYDAAARGISAHPTRIGKPLGKTDATVWTAPMVQKLIDQIANTRGPTAANASLRYLSRLMRWAKNRGYVVSNPAAGIEPAKERKKQTLVTDETYIKLIDYAKACGKLKPKTKGSAPDYLWMVLEVAYLCRLRGIEVVTITEDQITEAGVICKRTKGSRTNIAEWTPRLRNIIDTILARRKAIWEATNRAMPIKPEHRPLFVNNSGDALVKSTFDSAWQRLITRAMNENPPIITQQERFSAHDMKRKGATETKGTRADKQEAGGWKSASVVDAYDKSIPLVKPSGE